MSRAGDITTVCTTLQHPSCMQRIAGMDVCGKGSQLKARACSVRYNRGEGVRVSNAAHATLHHVTCSGNAAHGIAVLSGARLEASDITSATDGHHALFAHGNGVQYSPFI